jgi:hypothetical protein
MAERSNNALWELVRKLRERGDVWAADELQRELESPRHRTGQGEPAKPPSPSWYSCRICHCELSEATRHHWRRERPDLDTKNFTGFVEWVFTCDAHRPEGEGWESIERLNPRGQTDDAP